MQGADGGRGDEDIGYRTGCSERIDEEAMEGSLGAIPRGVGRKTMDGVTFVSTILEKMAA